MTYRDFWHPLTARYDAREAQAVARLVMEMQFGLSTTDIVGGAVEQVDEGALRGVQRRLLAGEPVQYVLGRAEFAGRTFRVAPGVLIPRPETALLCQMAARQLALAGPHPTLLDIGTGSGCIAVTLALDVPQARVTAWDLSPQALRQARLNARLLGADVKLSRVDATQPPTDVAMWDVIVSNPPYIARHEAEAMDDSVTRHEPAMALFVDDADPLCFYRAIAAYARCALRPGGLLAVEVSALRGEQTRRLVEQLGLSRAELHRDQYDNDRFVTAWKTEER